MKKQELITKIVRLIKYNAYVARVCDELHYLDFDVNMMNFYRDIANGKAFAGMEILHNMTGKAQDSLYEQAIEEATQDIRKTNYNIVKLLDLAGFDGELYYKHHI